MTEREPLAVRVARGWCRAYTRGLEVDARDRRRMELESDLWEHLHDPAELAAARALVGRFVRGIPADVRWRYRTLLESRGARPRSEDMETTRSRDVWSPLATVFAVALLVVGVFGVLLGGSSDRPAAATAVGAIVGVTSGGLVLAGLRRRRRDLLAGSRLIVAGGALTLVGGIELIPIGALLLISGFWTGNLRLSETDDAPDIRPVAVQQDSMTRLWFVWLAVAVVCFAIGWIPLVFDNPDDTTDLSFGGWYVWILSWLAAVVTGGIGLVLAGLRIVVRHRTRLA